MRRTLLLVIALLLIASCARTRDPLPIAMKQGQDTEMPCQTIIAEYSSNTQVACEKIAKNNDDDVMDVVVGGLVWPGLADFKNADGIEGNALLDRNLRLMEIAKMKECDTSAFPPQPVRYD